MRPWILAIGAALGVALGAAGAEAAPSVWQRAGRPDDARRQDLIAEADLLELKYHALFERDRHRRPRLDRREIATMSELYLTRAALLLEAAGAADARDLFLRSRLASVYSALKQNAKAMALLEGITREDPPAPLRAQVYGELAIAYAHAGRPEDEIKAYTEALAVQPIAPERARLLSNRAEAHMLLGNITAAVEGYRAALALLSADYLLRAVGPTTLWGLAVALDRSGDLDGGLEAVRLARAYDAQDEQINGPGWFYVPDYDRHWYAAIGHWAVARKADVESVRVAAYQRAVASWEEYLTQAPREDRWAPIARVRLRQCEKERVEYVRRLKSPVLVPATSEERLRLEAERRKREQRFRELTK
jgi:tetratricopeptide (TPR) repeat protein